MHLFTFGQAHAYLAAQDYPFLHKIDGLLFAKTKNGQISYSRSLIVAQKFIWFRYRHQINTLSKLAEELKPSLCITDFEPTMPRVAQQLNIPCISIDSQHRFRFCSSRKLPFFFRVYYKLAACFVKFFIRPVDHTIITTFCYDYLHVTSTKKSNITLTNGMLRPVFEQYKPKDEDFILVYLHQQFGDKILDHLQHLQQNFKIYGYGALPSKGNMIFKDFSYVGFVQDLANCHALISHAGNQLLTEVRFYGKRVLAIPVSRQYEQYVNAYYIGRINMGVVCMPPKLDLKCIADFLEKHAHTNRQVKTMKHNGADDAVKIIRRYLC